jgi:hypothetical protein
MFPNFRIRAGKHEGLLPKQHSFLYLGALSYLKGNMKNVTAERICHNFSALYVYFPMRQELLLNVSFRFVAAKAQ